MLVRVCGASLCMMLFLTSALSMMGPSGPPEGSTHLSGRHRPEFCACWLQSRAQLAQ